jgi:hypothetical protein
MQKNPLITVVSNKTPEAELASPLCCSWAAKWQKQAIADTYLDLKPSASRNKYSIVYKEIYDYYRLLTSLDV